MKTRRATVDDAAAILPLATELYQLEDLPFDAPRARVALDKLLSSPELGFAIVAVDNNSVAGYAICTFGFDLEFAGRDAFLTEVLVAEAFRGRGLGTELLDAVEAEARACDVHALHLMVRPENDPARALYARRGYASNPRLVLTKRLAT